MDDSFSEYPFLAEYREALQQAGREELAAEVTSMSQAVETWASANPNQVRQEVAPGLKRASQVGGLAARVGVKTRSPRALAQWIAYAAVVVIGVVSINYIPAVTNILPSKPDTRTHTTAPGQRAILTLADGSKITLAPATTLRITGRTVDLAGEATFTVTAKNNSPFIVRAGGSETRVLGTTFSVRRYDGESNTQVVVAEGKVGIQKAGVQAVTLTAGQGITVSEASVMHLTDAEVTNALARSSGRLVFDNMPVMKVVLDLSRWYGVTFTGADNLDPEIRVTMVFAEPKLSTAKLVTLGAILGKRVVLVGNVVQIHK